jgi:hypothetical protein
MEGTIKNCSPDGFCAKLGKQLPRGTILVVQMTGDSTRCSGGDDLRVMGLAEVRWSQPVLVGGSESYETGLKYLMAY